MKPIAYLTLAGLCLAPVLALAQEDCPAAIEHIIEVCVGAEANQICYASGDIEAESGAADAGFSEPGDVLDVTEVSGLSLQSSETDWGVARMTIQAATVLLLGDVELVNMSLGNRQPTTVEVTASAGINVRSGPSTSNTIIGSLGEGNTVTADGRNEDSTWLHIQLPDDVSSGWVFAELVHADGSLDTLEVVNAESSAVSSAVQGFDFRSADEEAPCAGAPPGGILIQTSDNAIHLVVNGVQVSMRATAYLQAQPGGDMTVSVVEGWAVVEAAGTKSLALAGANAIIPLDDDLKAAGTPVIEAYDAADVGLLPVSALDHEVAIAAPNSAPSPVAIEIPATGEALQTTVLDEGVIYSVIVTGTYRYDEGERGEFADAQFMEDDEEEWSLRWNSVEFDGVRLLATTSDQVNHLYRYNIAGQGQPMAFRIDEQGGRYSDNDGGLTAFVFPCDGECPLSEAEIGVVIPSSGRAVETSVPLDDGVQYVVYVFGTYRYDEGEEGEFADALYREDDDNVWSLRFNMIELNGRQLDPDVEQFSNHVYTYFIEGDGGPLTLRLWDSAYDDNAGSLTATVYRAS